jgi:hypothetical protein
MQFINIHISLQRRGPPFVAAVERAWPRGQPLRARSAATRRW